MSDANERRVAGAPRVLVPEKLSPDGLALLRSSLDVDERKGLSAADLLAIIGEYDALLIRSETKVSEQLLKAAKKLKVVARAGVGVDNVDVKAATQLGIIVVNSPSGNIGAAAEHTIALLMALARNLPDACSSLKDEKWERSRLVGIEVKGKTLGIIGLGKGEHAFTLSSKRLRTAADLPSRSYCRPPRPWSGNECRRS
jgi:D-3-phosphoglycerate dehydrogenase / 2-oxoglutarate reductase